jgi:hypothetical protein
MKGMRYPIEPFLSGGKGGTAVPVNPFLNEFDIMRDTVPSH